MPSAPMRSAAQTTKLTGIHDQEVGALRITLADAGEEEARNSVLRTGVACTFRGVVEDNRKVEHDRPGSNRLVRVVRLKDEL